MKLAIIADWLPTFAGAEQVIAQFHALWPDAPVFTTVAKKGSLGPLDSADIHVSKLQKWYRLLGNHQVLLPWMPQALENIDLSDFDIVLSSSHAIGKGIVPPSTAVHICYCHTPMRYAWEMEQQYLDDFHVPKFLHRTIKEKLRDLRRWDLTTAKRTDAFIANSSTTQERIERIYGRESAVIHPPVDDRFFDDIPQIDHEPYFLAIGRLVPYKRFDLLIEAANDLKLPLQIAGTGQDEARLKRMAGPTVEFLGFVPNETLPMLYAHAQAVLSPQFEDAGVAMLEAQACGTPVIAYGKGGALDTVVDGTTGLFFEEQSVASLTDALERFEKTSFDRDAIREHAKQFSGQNFRMKIDDLVKGVAKKVY